MKKFLAFFLIFALLFVTVPVVCATEGETELQYDFIDGNGKQHRYYYIDNGDGTCRFHSYLGSANELSIPKEIMGLTVTSIDDEAFYNKVSLTFVNIPDTVLVIGLRAFAYCYNLSSVVIGKSVRFINSQAFQSCTSLTGINVQNVEAIGHLAFSHCTSMTSFRSQNQLTYIGENAFEYCTSLNFIRFSNTLETISASAFKNCTALTTVTFPDSLTKIGARAFQNCTGLETVTFGDGALIIDMYAFENCTTLTEVTIPQTVVSIGKDAFRFREEDAVSSTATHPVKIICNLGSAGVAYGVASGAPTYIIELDREVIFGDIDGNGQITLDDAIKALRIVSGVEPPLAEEEVFYCDINNNGILDLNDARAILKREVNIA